MWKQVAVLAAMACASPHAEGSPWYGEAGYAGGSEGSAAIGYQFRPWLGIEAGYRRSEDGKRIGWGVPRRLDDADGFEVAMRSAIEVSPRFALTGRFGLYDWNGEALAFRSGDAMPDVVERDGVSPILGAGLRVKLTEHFALTGEYAMSDAFERTSDRSAMISAGIRASF